MLIPPYSEEDVLTSLDAIVERELPLLRPVADCWQPSDLLPDLGREDWRERLEELRAQAAGLSDPLLVVLVGNIVTEEALPSYQTWLNRTSCHGDDTGTSDSPWGRWSRGWTAEEHRHGAVLSAYLQLSGRVNMRSVEVTTQHLINNGFDVGSGDDPFKAIVYAAFQERATKISHANTGRLAEKNGDLFLARICSQVASDEARHEEAYKRFFAGALKLDAPRAVTAFAYMMRRKIAMPARLMEDGTGRDLFNQFAVVAQKHGIYTAHDYADVIAHLVEYWGIARVPGLFGEAAEAQDYLSTLSSVYSKKADRIDQVLSQIPPEPFSWIFDRKA